MGDARVTRHFQAHKVVSPPTKLEYVTAVVGGNCLQWLPDAPSSNGSLMVSTEALGVPFLDWNTHPQVAAMEKTEGR